MERDSKQMGEDWEVIVKLTKGDIVALTIIITLLETACVMAVLIALRVLGAI